MGLRLAEGVDLARISRRSGVAQTDLLDDRKIDLLSGHGLLNLSGNRLIVTPAGMQLLDRILPEIVAT
jgi:oxygen-independent coproporphyrinogen-3 oxidase